MNIETLTKLNKALRYADREADRTSGEGEAGICLGIIIAMKIIDPTFEFAGYVDEAVIKEYLEKVSK